MVIMMADKLTNPKKYNRRIHIQEKKAKLDPEGIPVGEKWDTVNTLWAFRKPLTSRWREYFQSAGLNVEKMFQYEIRYREGITEDLRIVNGTRVVNGVREERTFEIKAVLDDVHGDRTETWIMAEELTTG